MVFRLWVNFFSHLFKKQKKFQSTKNEDNISVTAIPEKEAKEILVESIDEYIHHNIDLAAEQIAITACEKIRDGDVLLTYGW